MTYTDPLNTSQVGNNTNSSYVSSGMEDYVHLVEREIAAMPVLGDTPMQTLFFGGGTPSLLPPDLLDRLISAVDRRFGLVSGAEISMEVDPGTFDADKLTSYMNSGA